ncbi:MAG: hypothetical protein KGK17_00930 [Betaproteobacteria bacterium]|nr:hypothetical protein [Betaproteobacteria bacterium]
MKHINQSMGQANAEIRQRRFGWVKLVTSAISKIKDLKGNTTDRCGEIPKGYPFYLWFKEDGYNNLSNWVEKAAQLAGC